VDDFIEILRAVDGEADRSLQMVSVLRWLAEALRVEGCALVDLEKETDQPRVLAAHGTLERLRESGALRIEGDQLPSRAPGCVTVRIGPEKQERKAYFHPLYRNGQYTSSGILIHYGALGEGFSGDEKALCFAGSLLASLREQAILQDQIDREKAFISLLVDRKLESGASAVNPGFDLVTEGLDLPLYMCDLHGVPVYASPAFLKLVGYGSLIDIRQRPDFFLEPQRRAAELELLKARGKVSSYPLAVRAGNGARMDIQDSAVTVGAFLFGVFFDVTGFVAANKEFQEALQIQELLNDRIIAASQNLQRTQVTSIRALARLAEFRDQETGFHLQRICEYTRIVAQQIYEKNPYSFRITPTYASDISLSSMLHDIGKVGIPDCILLKRGKLSSDEWETMKRHTTTGWDILHRADKELGEQSFLTLAATIALSHHEHYDGSGYPSGLVGERIPLSARISTLADVYDALTTKRPYKDPWDHERAVEEIVRLSGTFFDPVLAEIFVAVRGEFDGIRKVFPG
jgi:HD-GYP domain-containing protein (c-di-GMP phosphodiesterase class II)